MVHFDATLTMPCPQDNLISRFHDGELTADEQALVESHLAVCEQCRRALRSYRRVSAVFDRAEPVRLSNAARDRILLEVRSAARWRVVSQITRPFAIAAAVILALGVPLLALSPQGSATGEVPTTTAAAFPVGWEATLLTRDTEPARDMPQVQLAEFMATDLSLARR